MIALVAAVALSTQPFRYERDLRPRGAGATLVVADAAMTAHARADFSDVRIVDARGNQVPWRFPPTPGRQLSVPVKLLDVGRRDGAAVARFANTRTLDRVVLDVPGRHFTGTVTVLGSDDRRSWTTLSTTEIYDVGGAAPARSTTALLPPTDLRWIELRATGVRRIAGATVSARGLPDPVARIPATFAAGVLDLRYRVPVEQLRLSAATARYARRFRVETAAGTVVADGLLVRNGPPHTTVVPLGIEARRLRVVIVNGDNPPLRGLRVAAYSHRRIVLVEGGHPRPLRLYYGASIRAPEYDFARLPLGNFQAVSAALGPERRNAGYRIVDTRSFFARHRSLVTLGLALGAAAVLGASALALRRT